MTKNRNTLNYKWLHISDIHIYDCTDWNLMKDKFKDLAKHISPDFLVVTGDYRHIVDQPDFLKALDFLNYLVGIFNLKKRDVFLVPGNHDIESFFLRDLLINNISDNIEKDPDAYMQYLSNSDNCLLKAFNSYKTFIKDFYGDTIDDERINNPENIWCVPWNNCVNILGLNTALISNGKRDHSEIIDIEKLSKIDINNSLPTIVLAHHAFDLLADSHQIRLKSILQKLNTCAYLCGDRHQLDISGIEKFSINSIIPCIVCGKATIQPNDQFSNVNIIFYDKRSDGKAYVQVYKWNRRKLEFKTCSELDIGINTPYSFIMSETTKMKRIKKTSQTLAADFQQVNEKDKPTSIWLPDAEYATGKQTRFNSFTCTDAIKRYFDEKAGLLGVVSAKGIGKTFVLQVKRVKSARKYWCLPVCSKPSIDNHWATERVSFKTYASLKTKNAYDDLVLLWKFAIRCYVINYLININDNEKTLLEYYERGSISGITYSLCKYTYNRSLEAILRNIVNTNQWEQILQNDDDKLHNLCDMFLRRRTESITNAKKIAIFIDKVDQAVKQTNAEPPADCVLCKKRDNYIECKSSHKSEKFCSSDDGCQSKNCCYGCEIFASEQSSSGLRVYENSNTAKRVYVNIWQYLQLALMNAADQIAEETNGGINVFYTIRQEALSCEQNRLGEQNQKIAGRLVTLSYSIDDHRRIFYDCIRQQDPSFLYNPNNKNIDGKEEYAFVGVSELCHPYCKDKDGKAIKESVFTSIYRHSFDRSRDIQRYGAKLTQKMNVIRSCENEQKRGEEVKHIIEELAASIAYCSKNSETTINPSYYTEKMRYLPNFWADNDNFEYLLSLIDRNLLFEDDVKRICRIINKHSSCPISGCNSLDCKHHPFSMLYNMGYLGYVMRNENNQNDEVQKFLDANDITYFVEKDNLKAGDRVAYIIHPALSKAIESQFNKSFMHFSGFILGKDLKVDSSILKNILNDKKRMTNEEFVSKYYHNPIK